MPERKIKHTRITERPKTWRDPMPEVFATFEDGEQTRLFDFYPDEISFTPQEFIGLTEREARELKRKKDVRYLQSPD